MIWNWQKADWTHFSYKSIGLDLLKAEFLRKSGVLFGVFKHLSATDKTQLVIELLRDEALKTSEIEGEFLNRESIQSSLRKHFGMQTTTKRIPIKEQGTGLMMIWHLRSLFPMIDFLHHAHKKQQTDKDKNIGHKEPCLRHRQNKKTIS
jgi:hypothetical protein